MDDAKISIIALNRSDASVLWMKDGIKGLSSRIGFMKNQADAYLTVGKNKLFYMDGNEIVCLNKKDGKEAWRVEREYKSIPQDKITKKEMKLTHYYPNLCTLVYHDDMLYLSHMLHDKQTFKSKHDKPTVIAAYDANSGKNIWNYRGVSFSHAVGPDLFIIKNLIWGINKETKSFVGLDLKTGKEIKSHQSAKKVLFRLKGGAHQRCFRNKASENFMMVCPKGIELVSIDSGNSQKINHIKPICSYGLMPANGLMYFPPHACTCFISGKINGLLATSQGGDFLNREMTKTKRLTMGDTPYKNLKKKDNNQNWPVYRHDNKRSSFANMKVSDSPKVAWKTKVKGTLTQPIIADSKVFVANSKSGKISCLNIADGKTLWGFIANGGVDSSPSYSEGYIYFGTRSGYVYCLQATTGKMIWNFNAERFPYITRAFGIMESAWPVHGSVMVLKDNVYFTAGRATRINKGILLYVLNKKDGSIIHQKELIHGDNSFPSGYVSDLLVENDGEINMRQFNFSVDKVEDIPIINKNYKENRNSLYAAGTFLDTSWSNATKMIFEDIEAQNIIFNNKVKVAIRQQRYMGQAVSHYPYTPTKSASLLLYAVKRNPGFKKPKKKKKNTSTELLKKWNIQTPKVEWGKSISMRGQSMILTSDKIFMAGTDVAIDKKKPWSHIKGESGSLFKVYSLKDGTLLHEAKYDFVPVFDGISAAGKNLIMSTKDGSVVCFN